MQVPVNSLLFLKNVIEIWSFATYLNNSLLRSNILKISTPFNFVPLDAMDVVITDTKVPESCGLDDRKIKYVR